MLARRICKAYIAAFVERKIRQQAKKRKLRVQAAVITLHVRAIEIALRPSYRLGLTLDGQPLAAPRSLSLAEAQVLNGLARQYAVLCSATPEAGELVHEQQRTLGVALFNLLLRDIWADLAEHVGPDAHRTLVIDTDCREILDLPWALLRPPSQTFLADDPRFAVVLRPPSLAETGEEPGALPVRPLKVLFMACAPGEDGPVLREECAALRATAFAGPHVELAIAELGTAHELASQLASFRPHLVHLSGPCRTLRRCPRCRRRCYAHHELCPLCGAGLQSVAAVPCFGFECIDGDAHWVDVDGLRAMLTERGVRCVWLTDTDRDPHSRSGAARLCEALACAELPFAIGWACSLGASGAARLAAGVYAALAAGLPVDAALARAGSQAREQAGSQRPNWPSPFVVAARRGSLMATTGGSVAAAIERGRARGLPAVHAAHAAGRRRQVGAWLQSFRSGELRTLMLVGGEGVGQREVASFLTRRAVEDGLQPLRLPSSPDTPLTTARLLYSAASALRPHDSTAARRLLERREPVGGRLSEMLRLLAKYSFVLVLDRFEFNLDPASRRVADPWLATFCADLLYGRADTPRTILASSVAPSDWDAATAHARVDQLAELSEEAFLAFLLHDPNLAAAVDSRQLTRRLIHELYWQGGCARWPEQTQAAARLLQTDELEQLVGALQTDNRSSESSRRADALFGCLYGRLSQPARAALPRSSTYYAPVGQEALAAAAAVDRRSTGPLLREWRSRALADCSADLRWSVVDAARPWLLAPPRLSDDQRRGALVSAADYLVRHVAERVRTVSTGAELDYWMEARAKYLTAADQPRAAEATRRVERVLERWGLPDDIEHLHQELEARFAAKQPAAPRAAHAVAPPRQQPMRQPRARTPVI